MSRIPERIERLLAERRAARSAKDFARADEIRDEISGLGFDIRDAPGGATVVAKPTFETVDPNRIEDILSEPSSCEISIHLLYEGFGEDVERFIAGIAKHCADHDFEIVLVDAASEDGERLERFADDRVRVLHLDRETGWAEARNAGLRTSRGRIVALADLSVEPTGDMLAPVLGAFEDPAVGVAGPWGLTSKDMREFQDSRGPEVDAVEGYFLATRRELLAQGLIDEKFKWYRIADIDLSFQLRALGCKAVVVDAPAVRHTHRGWAAASDVEERTKRSKRNFSRFLDHWKHRHDLLLSHRD